MNKWMVLSFMSYAIQVCIGTQVDILPSEEEKISVFQRFRHIYTSAYRKTEKLYYKMNQAFKVCPYRLRVCL